MTRLAIATSDMMIRHSVSNAIPFETETQNNRVNVRDEYGRVLVHLVKSVRPW